MSIWRGTTSNNWATASNWHNNIVPSATEDAIFDATSTLPCTTEIGLAANQGRACRDLITTGFTNVLTIGAAAATIGYINVSRNITLGSSSTHIAGLSYIGIFGATCLLDVATGFTVPYLSFGTGGGGGTGTVTLVRSFVVTTLLKQGATGTITAGSAMTIDVTNGSYAGSSIIFSNNVVLRFIGTCLLGTCTLSGGELRLDTGATLTPRTTGVNAVSITVIGTTKLDFSQGTFVNPPINASFNQGFYIALNNGTHTFNFGSNSIDSLIGFGGIGGVSIILQSNLVINRAYYIGYATLFTGAFDIIIKQSIAPGAIRSHPSGKLIYQSSSTGFIALGYISGTTLTITTPIQGQLSYFHYIHIPSAGTTNRIQTCVTFNSVYTVLTSQTIGSAGSPVMIYGNSIMGLGLNDNTAGPNVTFEIDAGANDVYLVGQNNIYNNSSFTYLASNTGAFYGENGSIAYISGSIDFQGQSSASKKIGTILNAAFYSNITLKSDLWIQNLNCTAASGLSQIGTRSLYVLGNITANIGNSAGVGFVIQPTVILYGSDPCTFTCTNLNANITIDKVGGTVTNMSNFNYVTTNVGIPYTFKLENGTFIHGPYITTIGSTAIFNTPGVNWNSITVSNNVTLTISSLLNITGTLTCLGSATFAGAFGWTTNNFTCTVALSIIKLQNIVASSTAEYIVNGFLQLTGTLLNRISLEASGRANFTGSIETAVSPTGSTMNITTVTSGTIATGMTVSQASGVIPAGLAPFINDRPTIVSGASLSWVLSKTLITRVPTPTGVTTLAAGYKAKFTLSNNGLSSQSVFYVSTQDIDSSFGSTILVAGSAGDDTAVNTALYRTLNWGPLIVTSSSVYYTFVN